MPEEERKKKDDEKEALALQETEDTQNLSKRKSYRLFIYGQNFLSTEEMVAEFTWNDTITCPSPVVYKNPGLMATTIPDMGVEVPEGDHQVSVRITLNGQQFNKDPLTFLYRSVDPNLTEEELKKMDEEDLKNAKKPKKK